jgi:zinc D-Ala-D-Ala carboxypeptidase
VSMVDSFVSRSFRLSEFLRSETAVRRGLDNTPPAAVLANIQHVLAPGMQRVRDALDNPVHITSGYRSPAVNRAVGGSAMSQHTLGLAADFVAPNFGSPRAISRYLADQAAILRFDQLIFEGTWVHISFVPAGAPRGQVLTAHFSQGGVTYSPGIA